MLLPSKVTSYNESILSKFPLVLSTLKKSDMSALDLFGTVKNGVVDVGEFLEVLDCLYALNKIELTKGKLLITIKQEVDS